MTKSKKELSFGNKFLKPDIERTGYFTEMPYINKKYVSPHDPAYIKGLNMLSSGNKRKCGNADGYFNSFQRIFVGEYNKSKKVNTLRKSHLIGLPFKPAGPGKKHGSPGDYYGTFSNPIKSFGCMISKKKYVPEKPNAVTNPVKKGGPGYVDITLNTYPSHSTDKYGLVYALKAYGKKLNGPMLTSHYTTSFFQKNPYADAPNVKKGTIYIKTPSKKYSKGYFIPSGPGKLQGGCHTGCFDKFSYSSNKYNPPPPKSKLVIRTPPFVAHSTAEKSKFTTSVLTENIRFRINHINYENFEPTFTKYLLSQ